MTGNGASWFTFIAMSIGFLSMLYLVHAEQVERWGRGMRNDSGGTDADPSGFGVRTGAMRGSALAIGTTATAMALALPIPVPTLEVTLFEGTGPGTKKIEVADPMVDLRRDLSRGQDIPLMWVTTAEKDPSYFRLAVLTRFNGNTRTPGDRDIPPEQVARGEMPSLTGVAAGTNRSETPYHVRVSKDFESSWLPTTPQVSKMTVIGDWRYDLSTMDFMNTDGDTAADMTYSFTGVEVEPDPALMDNSVSGAASVRAVYTEVPGSISSEIRTPAASVTADEVTRFRKARALQQWFREDGGFEYSDQRIDDDPGSLAAFLDESGRVGYCEQFAASMAIMARIIGIPARVAVGFPEATPAGANQYEFSAHDLHARPELYFPGAGWVRFEPTPGARAETVPPYTSAELAPIASESPSTSAAVPDDQLPDRGASPDASNGSETDEESSLPRATIVLVTLVVLLLVALVLLPSFVRRQRRDRRLLGDIEELWLELRDHAVDPGHGWPHGRSPRAAGARLAGWFRCRRRRQHRRSSTPRCRPGPPRPSTPSTGWSSRWNGRATRAPACQWTTSRPRATCARSRRLSITGSALACAGGRAGCRGRCVHRRTSLPARSSPARRATR
ncbi:DUF3488 and transglutaminase-like domain-containing protein [Nocardioides sp. B-3]|nr:DUF3488 and transglutaminase-like domain-containing protein [Nocardioides sp. B-3]